MCGVGENGLTTELEDLAYKLSISVGSAAPTVVYTKDLTGALYKIPPNSSLSHWTMTRWTREFWIGGTPPAQVNIDNNLAYLESTRFLPNLDPAISIPATQITNSYNNYLAAPHDIYDGYWNHGVPWTSAMGVAGDSVHIGPYPLWVMVWGHSRTGGLG